MERNNRMALGIWIAAVGVWLGAGILIAKADRAYALQQDICSAVNCRATPSDTETEG